MFKSCSRAVSCAFVVSAEILTWEEFKLKYRRSDNSDNEDEAYRKQIFESNVKLMEEVNGRQLPYKYGVNQFSDLTREEFESQFLSTNLPKVQPVGHHERTSKIALPKSVDWENWGALNPIKNQDQCGSCWAFAASGALEAAHKIRRARADLASFSEQQMVDCVPGGGCAGGLSEQAFDWAESNAICTESQYPYTAIANSCQSTTCTGLDAGVVTGHKTADRTDEGLMQVLDQQPLTVYINASQMQLYESGILDVECYKDWSTNHAVLAVGYGTDGLDYFRVRNSWGTNWGEKGYFRAARGIAGQGALCMLSYPYYPDVKGDTYCSDHSYSQDWNYGCSNYCGCSNPDGSKKFKCDYCCLDDGSYCHRQDPEQCPFSYSKDWNYGCSNFCACNNPDGSHKSRCDYCCKISVDGLCYRSDGYSVEVGVPANVSIVV